MTSVDTIFLESQMSALKQHAEKKLGEEATVCLYSDGSSYVETVTGSGFGFESIIEMLETIEDFKHRD